MVSNLTYGAGYPLDDAWIHQTYARNLAAGEGWSFIAGQISGGSTAPLWSILLAIGYYLRMPPYAWTLFLGWLSLWCMAVVGTVAFQQISTARILSPIWAGILITLEWHLVWASASGMETSLFALLCLLVIAWLVCGWGRWIALGALIGLSVWIRPDGITLIGPALWVLFLRKIAMRDRLWGFAGLASGFFLLFLPYLFFNLIVAGEWWPNTFFAKQAEYAIALNAPFWKRLLEQSLLPMVGVGVLLLPGFASKFMREIHSSRWASLAAPLWAMGFILLYVLRLPVTYQHGRYIIPMMPVFFLWGIAGMVEWLRLDSPVLWRRVLSRAWQMSAGIILLAFWILGARSYGRDVAFIQSEMVKTAHWVAQSTEKDAIIAAHDIGALGYFSNRQILDLAGLVSPEVIPFIRNENILREYLYQRSADYLVTFPGWYPSLVQYGELIYTTGEKIAPELGGENMAVYRWLTKP